MDSVLESPPNERTLRELVHLALGTPEVGAVNFNILQTLLLALLDKLKLQDSKAAVAPVILEQLPIPRSQASVESTNGVGIVVTKSSSFEDLDKKVSKIENQLTLLNSLPSNADILGKTKSDYRASDVWQHMTIQKTVQNNESGITRALSLIDELLKDMQSLKDEQSRLSKEVTLLKEELSQMGNPQELESRVKKLEDDFDQFGNLQKDLDGLSEKLGQYPDPSEFETYITWPVLEEALSQHMKKMEDLQQARDTAEEMLSGKSSPQKSSSSSRLSSAKEKFPQATDMLERVGALSDKHIVLEGRVDVVEDTLPTKADKSDLEGLGGPADIPDDLLEQLNCLKQSITALENNKDQMSDVVKMQQDSIDNILTFKGGLASVSDEESSGYESAAGMSPVELRKLEIYCQRLGGKLNSLAKQLSDMNSSLQTQIDKNKASVTGVTNQLSEFEKKLIELFEMTKNVNSATSHLKNGQGQAVDEALAEISNVNSAIFHMKNGQGQAVEEALAETSNVDGAIFDLKNGHGQAVEKANKEKAPAESSLSLMSSSRLKRKDSGAISGIQTSLLNLQAEMEKLARLIDSAIEEHKEKQKHIDTLYGYTEKLSETKADKENVRMEIDVKADKRIVDSKVNVKDFDSATSEITKSLDEMLEKILGQENNWQKALKKLSSDVDGKLDRLELENLKMHLENRMKAMKKLIEKHQPQEMFADGDDAAGFRKQLLQNYHCISCDRPVELTAAGPIASIPATAGLPATKSVRPYTSFELDQIRQQARGTMQIGRNSTNYRAALEEREIARLRKLDQLAFKTHYPQGDPQMPRRMDTEEIEYMLPSGRSCGGGYTMTFPHRRYTRLTHLSELWQDEEAVVDSAKQEVELQGHDGHIYRGRLPVLQLHQHLAAKGSALPEATYDQVYGNKKGMPMRPLSARSPNRPFSAGRRTPASSERPRTAGRSASHITVATQDVQKPESVGVETSHVSTNEQF